MSKFVMRETPTGVKFDLRAPNGQVILTSEVYASRAACRKGIESIRKNAPKAHVENQTEGDFSPKPNPKFELYRDRSGEFRFRLRSKNGRIIGISEGYAARAGCINGMESVMRNASGAQIEE